MKSNFATAAAKQPKIQQILKELTIHRKIFEKSKKKGIYRKYRKTGKTAIIKTITLKKSGS